MSVWLLDTLVWTGVLLALVMVLRRPVARHFGPQAAYALWALPFLRLLVPSLTLPAWMNPAPARFNEASAETVAMWGPESGDVAIASVTYQVEPVIDWLSLALALWLVGVAAFLVVRFRAYFTMRDELLADAREVGRVDGGRLGPIRLVETPATNTPLAFGVLDRVIALPPRFLALAERPMRDLALAHELAHHRGGDLIANFAVQPLFALHWFNPLGWVGWRAMRRDQEAACDARVVRTADAGLRATYAQTIASFAAGPRVALAAPMACPVLGDKSIIHRLRSLTMSDISARRRWAGRSLLLAGALALPLTASISYAETAPEPPLPPAAPDAPDGADIPDAPEAPEAPAWSDEEGGDVAFASIDREDDGKVIERRIVRTARRGADGNGDQVYIVKRKDKDGNVRVEERRIKRFTFTDDHGREISHEQFEREIESKWEAKAKEFEKMGEEMGKRMALRFADVRMVAPTPPVPPVAPVVRVDCSKARGTFSEVEAADGKVAVSICTSAIVRETRAIVAKSLGTARRSIQKDRNLSAEERAEALRAIDEEIARLDTEA